MFDPILILNLLPQPLFVVSINLGVISYMNESFESKFDHIIQTKLFDDLKFPTNLNEIIGSLNEENAFKEIKNISIIGEFLLVFRVI